jgi:NAD(P)H-hydrate epimerase
MEFRLSLVPVHTAAAVRAADAAAQRDHDLPGRVLMQAAAGAALQDLRMGWPQARDLVVVCGAGNNAGDGYDLATQARTVGLRPVVVAVGLCPKPF